MKYVTSILAIFFAVSMAVDCQAQPPNRDGGKRKGQKGQRSEQGPPRAGDPSELAARMMTEFDQNGDNKLDATELTAMFTSMRERRAERAGQGKGPRGKGRKGAGEGGPGKGADGKAKGRRGGKKGKGKGTGDDDGFEPKLPGDDG